ncbi:hypothetical protein [Lacticaseibacillus manihotivorans]|nr:hypothetical protein [Lacticaseibacillus manihotivorans]QFQ91118.1 hypothetical protein LM010_06610 [Lacticaseibacillus manihotivorans]
MGMGKITVATPEELAEALHQQVDEITVSNEMQAQMQALANRQLSDADRLGFEIGGRGVLTVLEHGLNHVQAKIQKGDKLQAQIDERVLGLYKVAMQPNGEALLRLKQLDY